MSPFSYERAKDLASAVSSAAVERAAFLAGGTSLIDLMKLEVLRPKHLIDLHPLGFTRIEVDAKGARLGALATNTALAEHAGLKRFAPMISEALLSGAAPQLRNVATLGGNLLQRTRCAYYRDLATPCNKRTPGSGCGALGGWSRMHAILGASSTCIATHPSDLCVALAATDATVEIEGTGGARQLAFTDLHLLPLTTPEREFALAPGELITAVTIAPHPVLARSAYVKVRDRSEFAFALSSCAAALELKGTHVVSARIALGGVATKPWRAYAAEALLAGKPASLASWAQAAKLALAGATVTKDNAFKLELCQRVIVRALSRAAEQTGAA